MRKSLIVLGILNDSDLEWIIANSRKHHLRPGQFIIKQGEPVSAIYFVLEGELAVWIEKPVQRKLSDVYPGEILGEISLLDSRPPAASVKAVENSLLLGIPKEVLNQKLDLDFGFQARLYKALAILLANRLRKNVELYASVGGGGGPTQDEQADAEEVDPVALDGTALASRRFELMVSRSHR